MKSIVQYILLMALAFVVSCSLHGNGASEVNVAECVTTQECGYWFDKTDNHVSKYALASVPLHSFCTFKTCGGQCSRGNSLSKTFGPFNKWFYYKQKSLRTSLCFMHTVMVWAQKRMNGYYLYFMRKLLI